MKHLKRVGDDNAQFVGAVIKDYLIAASDQNRNKGKA